MVNARSIQGIIVLIIALFLAIWLGLSIVTDQTETLVQIAAISVILLAIFLGRRVWLLMVFASAMNVMLVRGIGTADIGQVVFLTMSLAMFMMRKLRLALSFGELEMWTLLIIASIVQAYLRNPVGLNIFGGSTVGGRPYITLAFYIVSAVVLSQLRVEPKELKWAMNVSLLAGFLRIPGNIVLYGNLSGSLEEEYARVPSLAALGQTLANWLSSKMSPLKACFRPFWLFILLVSLAAATGSAYRNAVAGVFLTYFFATWIHGGFHSVFLTSLAGTVALTLLALINLNAPLPGNIQRALSPFPGTWEKQYVEGADDSTEWRVEMWKEALLTERWIHNKVFGDGIGMTAAQLQANENSREVGKTASGLLAQQEAMLINGSYHSGPVHSIRAVGYVGLVILLMAMIRVAVHAFRQMLRYRGTEWSPTVMFFGIPLLVQPVFFVFIFGEYQTGVAGTMMGIAMLRLFEKNLPPPSYATNSFPGNPLPSGVQPYRA
jgi:hypothetical protein